MAAAAAARCGDVNLGLAQLADARHLAADLTVQFVKAADAANLAVLATTTSAAVAFDKTAEQAKQAVQKDVKVLEPMLQGLHYEKEVRLLQDFTARFNAYAELDRRILDMAVENSNLEAQRLSFGAAQAAVDSFRDALAGVVPASATADKWRIQALASAALASLRDIQALEAPHIAETADAEMTRLEKRMASSEADARRALASLGPLVPSGSQPRLAAATQALDQFMDLHAKILELSRRNTDVNSLALSLNEKRAMVTACEEALGALQESLAKRGYPRGRY
jgi:hypothetical protein